MKRLLIIGLCLFIGFASNISAAEWQWSVKLKGWIHPETGKESVAYLWIPPTCRQVRSVVMGMHNMTEETLFENPRFRQEMSRLGLALIWVTPGMDINWNVENGVEKAFLRMMDDLADVSGYGELKYAPVVPIGHSAMATMPWNFAAWNPERTLAVISMHGDAPQTNMTGYGGANLEWGRTRNIDGILGLMVMGEDEWVEDRLLPAEAFRLKYPESTVSFLGDAGHGHFDVSDELVDYLALFLQKAVVYRLPARQPLDAPVSLKKLKPEDGWLCDRWKENNTKRSRPAPYKNYKGDRHTAFWYFDKETAIATERYYAREAGKEKRYIGYVQNGRLLTYHPTLHARINGLFQPASDGLTFHVKAVYTNADRTEILNYSNSKGLGISRICGPVEKVNDTTFTVRFYRMGFDSPKRTNDIWLMASDGGNNRYKSSVQQLEIRIPYPNKEGKRQYILFSGLPDIQRTILHPVTLNATSDCGLPVYYYIKEGPAEISGNKIVFTPLPLRAKYPVKVTVVAWQYGLAGKVQTARPEERSFYIRE